MLSVECYFHDLKPPKNLQPLTPPPKKKQQIMGCVGLETQTFSPNLVVFRFCSK